MMFNKRATATIASALWLATTGGCVKSTDDEANAGGAGTKASGGAGEDGSSAPQVTVPEPGATEFVSADPTGMASANGEKSAGATGALADSAADESAGSASAETARSVERGDIYRLLDDGRILNLNPYRGLQVLNVTDPAKPSLEGRLAMSGDPLEMYVVDNIAYILLNNYQTYYGSRNDLQVQSVNGGLVAVVDLSDRKNPKLLGEAVVKGNLRTSRLTTSGSGNALYVAASIWDWEVLPIEGGAATDDVASDVAVSPASGGPRTVIKSFALESGKLVEKSEFELSGEVADIQATTDYMMVASHDYSSNSGSSTVKLINIASPDGKMVEGGEVSTRGQVQNKFNMDIRGNIMRVVSGRSWSEMDDSMNHVETFDISDPKNITAVDHCEFGANEDLYATLFVEDSAFFVTYFRTDPFHAFSINDQGQCEEQNAYIVSGWNSFFRAVSDNTRLVGVGTNDENDTRTMAVSLYDITDLQNASPMLARKEVALDNAYSEGSWDDRAFSVLENAVSVQAEDGTAETGLIMLPFEGWNDQEKSFVTAVQLFTFSDTTLTKRGLMQHPTPIRRTFLADDAMAANLSDQDLSLYDTQNPDMPKQLGALNLAPNFRQVFALGEYVLRVRDDQSRFFYYSEDTASATATVEVVKASGDLEQQQPIATVKVPAGATLEQAGDLLVSIGMVDKTNWDVAEPERKLETTIEVFDFSDPKAPESVGSLKTNELTPGSVGGWWGGGPLLEVADCFDCRGGYYGNYDDGIYAVGEALVFAEPSDERESLGVWEECYTYPENGGRSCWSSASADGADATSGCDDTWIDGGITCSTPKGGEETCSGEIVKCTEQGCEPVDDTVATRKECNTSERFRYWRSFSFEVLSLEDPSDLALGETIAMPKKDEGASVIVEGDTVYFNYQHPTDAKDDRAQVKRYVRSLDFADPAKPVVGEGVNIPGQVIAVEGNTLYTRDQIWGDEEVETMIAKLTLAGKVATLDASRVFEGRQVSAVEPDGAGHILVTHDYRFVSYRENTPSEQSTKLSILDADDLSEDGSVVVDSWGSFQQAQAGRAVFSVPGGILIMNVEDAAKPVAQAYFQTTGGGEMLLIDSELIFAAGPYGIYRFDLNATNLLSTK